MYLIVVYSTYWVIKYCTLLFYFIHTQNFFIDGPLKDKFLAPPLHSFYAKSRFNIILQEKKRKIKIIMDEKKKIYVPLFV